MVDAAMVDGSAQLMSIFFGLDAMRRLGTARHQPARRRRALLQRVRDAPTASTCRSRRTSRSSTPTCSRCIGPLGFDDLDPARPDGPHAVARAEGAASPRCSARGRAPSGSSSSPATRSASRRCCRCRRRAPIRTTSRATRSSTSTAPRSPHPRRASAARRARCRARRSPPGADTDTALADWGFAADEVAALKSAGAIA